VENVSVHGMLIHIFEPGLVNVEKGTTATIRVKPYSEGVPETMGINIVRSAKKDGFISVGSTFSPQQAVDHRLIADLIFASSEQWSEIQRVRRKNPGLIKGTITFMAIAIFQTQRGLYYFFRSLKPERQTKPALGTAKP
jgi:cellulose synthase (UDP-forming)